MKQLKSTTLALSAIALFATFAFGASANAAEMIKENSTSTSAMTAAHAQMKACVATAVDARKASMTQAEAAYKAAKKAALDARKAGIVESKKMTGKGEMEDMKKTMADYRTAIKKARADRKTAMTSYQKTYKDAVKVCRAAK